MTDAPSFEGVKSAAARLKGKAVETPLLENRRLNEIAGGRVLLKAEVLQHQGSFKFRGAYNLIAQLSEAGRARGVVAWSSGNHAQGVALAAKMFGMAATIVMPSDAPAIKTAEVRGLGAEIVPFDRYTEDREAIARGIAAKSGAAIAPSYDHPHIIEGQGTAALEAARQAEAQGARLEAFLVCTGGGGFAAGSALALGGVSPATEVFTVEPEFYDDWARSLASGAPEKADISKRTICDAIATPAPGRLTFPVLKSAGAKGLVVSDAEAAAAVAFAFRHLKLVLEPGGAVALAAVLSGKLPTKGRVIGLTLSGGNIDPPLLADILSKA